LLKMLLGIVLAALIAACGGSDDAKSSAKSSGGDTAYGDDGCGCGEEEEEEEEEEGGRQAYTPDKGTATIKGFAKFEGKPPRRRPIDMGTEKHCTGSHETPLLSETAMVGSDGGLANVFVRISDGLDGWSFPKASGEKVLDQDGCMYVPHMTGIQLGQTLRIRNSDPIMHNIHAIHMETGRDLFNVSQINKGKEDTHVFRRPGMVFVKCEVHGWMGAYVGVSDHPFFAITAEDGSFSLGKLPAGKYELEAWHEKYDTKKATVNVASGATGEATFTFSK